MIYAYALSIYQRLKRGLKLPATYAANLNAFAPTYDNPSESFLTPTVATVTSNRVTPTAWTLGGADAAGFDVIDVGGSPRVRLVNWEAMWSQGVRNKRGAARQVRVFTILGALAPCLVTVTLTLDAWLTGYIIPGYTVDVGITDPDYSTLKNPITEAAAGRMTGWTINTSVTPNSITQTSDSPTALSRFDFRGFRLFNYSKNSGVITQSVFGPTVAMGFVSGHLPIVDSRAVTTPLSLNNCTFEMDPDNVTAAWDAFGSAFSALADIAVLGAQNDCFNVARCDTQIARVFGLSGCTSIYTISGAPQTNPALWGHSDGEQSWATSGVVSHKNMLMVTSPRPWKYGAPLRYPAGTVAFTNGSTAVVGTGTNWLTDLNLGDLIRYVGGASGVVQSINSNTSVTLAAVYTKTISGVSLVVAPFQYGRSGVTSPMFLQGVASAGNRIAAGSVAATNGSATITGTGTSFVTGLAANIVSVGDAIKIPTSATASQFYYVTAVASDTSLTIASPAVYSSSSTVTIALRSVPLVSQLDCQDSILLGGTFIAQSHSFSVDGVNTDALILYKNNILDDALYGPIYLAPATTLAVQGSKTLRTGVAITDLRPLPVAPVFVQGATTSTSIALTVTAQDLSVDFFVRYKLTSGGAYSAQVPLATVTGLAANTSYDFEVQGKNCIGTAVGYLQAGPVTVHTYLTDYNYIVSGGVPVVSGGVPVVSST